MLILNHNRLKLEIFIVFDLVFIYYFLVGISPWGLRHDRAHVAWYFAYGVVKKKKKMDMNVYVDNL